MGTIIKDLQVTRVIDGDTLYVLIDDREEMLRLVCVDTEESQLYGSKPVTKAGHLATEYAKTFFMKDSNSFHKVDIEFDRKDPKEDCLRECRDNYGRLLCYVHKEGINYNIKVVQEGYSPYFLKYGRSRVYLREFMEAEFEAQSKQLVIWNPLTNMGGASRNYPYLIAWWSLRAGIIQHYRRMVDRDKVPNPRENYKKILEAMESGKDITIFCDIGEGVERKAGKGTLIYAGSKYCKFKLWIEDRYCEMGMKIIRLIETRYGNGGRGYAYVSGKVTGHKGRPEIILTDVKQISDFPPSSKK